MKESHEHAVKRGKTSRRLGKAFEVKVKKDLEDKGWIVVRWDKQVEMQDVSELENGGEFISPVSSQSAEGKALSRFDSCRPAKLVNCKPRFNPFTRSVQMMSGGFPDFLCVKLFLATDKVFDVMLVECKMNGKLDKIEKEKIQWIKENLKIPVSLARQDFPEENINLPPKKRIKKTIVYEEL